MKSKHFLSILWIITSLSVSAQWSKSPNILNSHLLDISASDDQLLFASGSYPATSLFDGAVFRSSNGGSDWDSLFTTTGRMNRIHVVDANIIYATKYAFFYSSTDGGSTWDTGKITGATNSLTDAIFFFNADTGFVGNLYGEIFKTTDGGQSWNLVSNMPFYPVYDISCPSRSTCYARTSMPPKLLKSVNNGNTWTSVSTAPNTFFEGGLSALTDDTIVMVTSESLIHRSIDGGLSWDTIASPAEADYSDVHFIDNLGFAIGSKETIIKSIDYGASWTEEISDTGSTEQITAIHMINSSTVIACSDMGSIYRLGDFNTSIRYERAAELLSVYPNPVRNNFRVSFKARTQGDLTMYDLQGKTLFNTSVHGKRHVRIDLSDVTARIILLQFTDHSSGNTSVKKLMLVD